MVCLYGSWRIWEVVHHSFLIVASLISRTALVIVLSVIFAKYSTIYWYLGLWNIFYVLRADDSSIRCLNCMTGLAFWTSKLRFRLFVCFCTCVNSSLPLCNWSGALIVWALKEEQFFTAQRVICLGTLAVLSGRSTRRLTSQSTSTKEFIKVQYSLRV